MTNYLTRPIPVWLPLVVLLIGVACWLLNFRTAALESDRGSLLLLAVGAALFIAIGGSFWASKHLAAAEGKATAVDGLSPSIKNHALIELEVARVLSLMRSRQMREQAYGALLGKARTELAGSLTADALRLLVEHLIAENLRVVNDIDRSEKELRRARTTIEDLRGSLEKANETALRDSLTDVCNRRGFDLYLEQSIKTAVASREDLSLVMCDVDYFKAINDKYGHQAGDEILRIIAQELSSNMRGSDIVCRYGGEEFAVILPRMKANDASLLADRARCHFEKTKLILKSTGESIGPVTASFGVTQLRTGESSAHLLKRIDEALYASKNAGRNRVSLL